MLKWLRASDAAEPVTLRRPAEIMLNSQGLVQGNLRLTTIALGQLCSAIAPGLSLVVADVAGMRKHDPEDAEVYSPLAAIRLLNELIKLRFESGLSGHGLVIDQRAKRIEAIVGPKYNFFSNLELYEMCRDFTSRRMPTAKFHAAALAGRRFLLRYKNTDRLFAVPTPRSKIEPFHGGWHFANSEIGDCSVRAAFALFRAWSDTAAVAPFLKLMHVKGTGFSQKVAGLFDRMIEQFEEGHSDLQGAVANMMGRKLGFGDTDEQHTRRMRQLVRRLVRGKISQRTAKTVIDHALVHGSYRADFIEVSNCGVTTEMLDPGLLSAYDTRTVYDLFNALTHIAKSQSPAQQELAEQLAYRIMTNDYFVV